ncbi:hypothetical protein BSFA1_04480 [Burkholderia sp. SFA1]|uniref:hypothetical protein n=1 Tax=unclassified Caballeronia TaxID=2646786 RepID=UPI0002388F9D|nr:MULTISPECIES: hypothetical protein [unclassified Caballeronia]AET88277.1 hypothetical protein BYI23_A004390 [Burkholderia sp. YI23]MCE4542781.1 hypothetical protein [Caballeronia sp. PC1]MCE4568163.1 hypothetical protein [Caballeronia sp. CLC5]BBP95319.1 hypothetical protein BSFA1_04480 [Burkholderia sp. SFA1]
MKKKTTNKKSSRPAMSPLLRALTYSRTAREPMIEAMLLQCYVALDAFHRGQGSQPLFMTLCRHMLVAEELCQLGHAPDAGHEITLAHEALVALDARHAAEAAWSLSADEHAVLCDALDLFAAQLEDATLEHIAQAEASMVTQSLVAANLRSGIGRAQTVSSAG